MGSAARPGAAGRRLFLLYKASSEIFIEVEAREEQEHERQDPRARSAPSTGQ
jgi:hypothetical protein